MYHALCQVGNLHGLAHLEHEDLPTVALGTCLEHQFAGLGDEHEVTDDIRMGDGDRSTVLDLLLEEGDHRTVGTQHIAESGGDKLSHTFHLAALDGLVETLHIDLTDTFRAAHHVRGVHGFIGRDHHKLPHTVLHGQVGYHARTIYIIIDTLLGVVLQHGHMLVGCRMEQVVGPVLTEQRLHVLLVTDAGHQHLGLDLRPLVHHQLDVVLWRLCLVYEHQQRGLELAYLLYDLPSDAACRARDHDTFVCELPPHRLHVDHNLLPRQQVFDADLLQLWRGTANHLFPLLGLLGEVDVDACLDQFVDQRFVLQEGFFAVGRHNQRLDALFSHRLHQVVIQLSHPDAHQDLVLHLRVVRDEALQVEPCGILVPDMLGDGDAAVLHAVDIRIFRVDAGEGDIVDGLHADAHQPQQEGGKHRGQHDVDGSQVRIGLMTAEQHPRA